MNKISTFRPFDFPLGIVLLASFWLLVFSWLWTGTLFNGNTIESLDWLALNGLAEKDVNGMPIPWQLLGIFGVILQTTGLATVLKWRGTDHIIEAAQTGLLLGTALIVPVVMLPMVYHPDHNVTLFLIDASKFMLGSMTTAMLVTLLESASRKGVHISTENALASN